MASADGTTRPGEGHVAIDLAGAAPTAERKLVSVLFADLVGFTPFAEERDSEEVRETLTRYFDLATEVVLRYGGVIEKFIGDAVMAVWGTPTAREDDAERAVRAGLDLLDAIRALGPEIDGRVGIITGEAAVTLGASNQGMVAGDIVNTAARIQSVAAPGTVLAAESTYRAASASIVFESIGDQALKGKSVPVPVWRALRVVAERGGRGRSDTLEAPFVGRDAELRLLKELFHGTARESRTRLVSITGIAGIGKSRLAWEFEKYLDGLVQRVWWHHGRSPAYDQGLTFWALGEMVRGRCELAELDDEATTRAKIHAAIVKHVPIETEQPAIEASLLALLGFEALDREGRPASPEELFAGWRTFFERLAGTGPVVMIFEDLHWADSGTLDFIDHLLDWAKAIPLTIVTLARPELLERRPDWGAGRRNFVSLSLEPLTEVDMRALLAGLVPGLPATAANAIVGRADGIPLYAVETVRMLVSDHRIEERDGVYVPIDDLTDLAVPDTLTAIIAARLDSLESADRSLILDAAVLGQSFTPAGLSAVSGRDVADIEPRLKLLVRREILAPADDARSPERGQYAFVQALIREVAYNTLARRDRRDRHLAAARFFESLGSDELAGAQAGHYLAAHDLAADGAEADALAAQARIALRAAADRAAALGSMKHAVRYLEQALTVTSASADQAELLQRAGELASLGGDHDGAAANLQRALDLVSTGDPRLAARVRASLAKALLNGKRREQAGTILDIDDDPALAGTAALAELDHQRARAAMFAEQHALAIEIADRVLAIAEHMDLIPLLADTLVTKGGSLSSLGRLREGLALIGAGQALAEANGLTPVLMRALINMANRQMDVDPRGAYDATRNGLALARRYGLASMVYSFIGNLGFVAFMVGEWEVGRSEIEAVLGDSDQIDPADRALMVNNLLNILVCRGDEIERLRDDLVQIVEAVPGVGYEALVWECDGWAAFGRGDHREARRLWNLMAELSPTSSSAAMVGASRAAIVDGDPDGAEADLAALDVLGIHGPAIEAARTELRAGIVGLRGDRQAATAGYREANRFWRSTELPWDEALAAMAMLRVLGPEDADAAAAAERARATFERLGAVPFLARLDDLVAGRSSPVAQRSTDSRTPVADAGARPVG